MTESPARALEILLGNVVEALPQGALEASLAEGRPLRVKFGIDPTAPDIHLGHVVILRKLREFQDLGHAVVLIIGDFTARVGDPSGRSETRPALSEDEVEANGRTFQEQAFTVLDRERTEVRHNSEWLDMSMRDLFALMRTATVAQILERDDFEQRHTAGLPISLLELLYPQLQGYDSVAVKADVEVGGTDQKFNLLRAREIQQAYGHKPQAVLTLPILPGTDGVRRMSKSLGNYIGVAEPPEEMFGKAMSVPDAQMPGYYRLLLGHELDPASTPVAVKRDLGRAIVDRFHGAEAAESAEAQFDRIHVEHAAPDAVEDWELPPGDVQHLPAVLAGAFGITRSEARRMLASGGVRLEGERLDGGDLDLPLDRIDGRVIQAGKRRFRRLRARS